MEAVRPSMAGGHSTVYRKITLARAAGGQRNQKTVSVQLAPIPSPEQT